MTSHERVLQAINHIQASDRIPMDYSAVPVVTEKLMELLGLKSYDDLLEAFNVDIRTVKPRYIYTDTGYTKEDGTNVDMFGIENKTVIREGKSFVHFKGPFGYSTTLEDINSYNWPDPEKVDLSETESLCYKYKDHGTLTGPWAPLFFYLFTMFGMEETMILFIDNPELMHVTINKIFEFFFGVAVRIFDITKGKVDIFFTGDDFASQRGLNISMEMYNEFFREPYMKLFSLAKDYGMKVMLHGCGAIFDMIPAFIEMGVDIVDPVQTSAVNMESKRLKEAYGSKICFHGAIDQQNILTFGTIDEVREHVRYTIRTLGKDGGYILCTSHDILPNVPIDNILAMYDEASKFRF